MTRNGLGAQCRTRVLSLTGACDGFGMREASLSAGIRLRQSVIIWVARTMCYQPGAAPALPRGYRYLILSNAPHFWAAAKNHCKKLCQQKLFNAKKKHPKNLKKGTRSLEDFKKENKNLN